MIHVCMCLYVIFIKIFICSGLMVVGFFDLTKLITLHLVNFISKRFLKVTSIVLHC